MEECDNLVKLKDNLRIDTLIKKKTAASRQCLTKQLLGSNSEGRLKGPKTRKARNP